MVKHHDRKYENHGIVKGFIRHPLKNITGFILVLFVIRVMPDYGNGAECATDSTGAHYPAPEIRFEHLSLGHGLSQSTVTCIAQDKKGFIWFGTDGGLNRYDGYDFRVFRNIPGDSASLSRNWVTALHVDHHGILWILTLDGILYRFNAELENFEKVRIPAATDRATDIRTVFMDRNGRSWSVVFRSVGREGIGTPAGLNRLMIRLGPHHTDFQQRRGPAVLHHCQEMSDCIGVDRVFLI